MNTPLTPEQSALLEEYAHQCRARFLQNPGTADTGYAINHPEQWEKNHAMSVNWDIQQGEMSWKQIEERVCESRVKTSTPHTPMNSTIPEGCIPFDLSKLKPGDPVRYRDGGRGMYLGHSAAQVKAIDLVSFHVASHNMDGSMIAPNYSHPSDLFLLADHDYSGTPSTPPHHPADCVVLPCPIGKVYFRRSAITAVATKGSLQCAVEVMGEDGVWTVDLPAPEVAELVFGKLS